MQNLIELILPDGKLADSYRSMIAEFEVAGESFVPFTLGFEHGDFAAMLGKLDECARGEGLPDGFVAHTTYWLVRNNREVIGASNLRHALTPALHRSGGSIGYGIRPGQRQQGFGTEILRQTILHARRRGLHQVLLTCNKENTSSAKVILTNGGKLESEEYIKESDEVLQRYWIQLSGPV